MDAPSTIEELEEILRSHDQLLPVGGGTTPSLCAEPESVHRVSLQKLSGILEYEPTEFTFTARAGTPIGEIQEALAVNGQYLPFDPVGPNLETATIGSTIAKGLNGPGSYRFGTLRDFVLAVEILDGSVRRLRSGAKVVKNAAGFDLPKFLVGSLGRYGIVTEASFKVFPCPPAEVTLSWGRANAEEGVKFLQQLALGSWDLDALELDVLELDVQPEARVVVRLRGDESAVSARRQRLQEAVHGDCNVLDAEAAGRYWDERAQLITEPSIDWVKVPLTPKSIPPLEDYLNRIGAQRHYSLGGNIAWIGVQAADQLSAILEEHQLTGLVLHRVQEDTTQPHLIGSWRQAGVQEAVRRVLDPVDRFPRLRTP